ncbi:hypothetical protein CYLTODRAFT_320566, partial [Cylindrobasidium torrendii FP15055 ss-10]
GCSQGTMQNRVLQKIVELMQDNNIWLTIDWISTHENIADPPSRGKFDSGMYSRRTMLRLEVPLP